VKRIQAPHLALALAAAAALSACTLNLGFDIDHPNVPVVTPGPATASSTWVVDLAQYKEVTDHKNNIRSLDLDSMDVTVTQVNGPNRAATLSGSVWLRKTLIDPPTNDVKIGDITNLPVQQGSTTHLKGNGLVDAFLLQQLQNGGTFTVVMSGTVENQADFVLDVMLHASLAYDSGIL
jgi:hypothetical protein